MSETALIVEVSEAEEAVHEWRARHDPVAARGVPAHVTVLFPFVAPDLFDESVLDALASVVNEASVFEFELVAVDEFPGAAWLRPEPDQPFRNLTRQLWRSFPNYPPYGGRFPDSQPHLTLATVDDGDDQAELATRIRADLEPKLPIRCSAEAVSVFMTDARGVWRREHRLELRS